jgi:hypothetical protein
MGAVGYGDGYGMGRNVAFILVLFILLVIITATFAI